MKIKTFQFIACYYLGNKLTHYPDFNPSNISDEQQIDKTVNDWIKANAAVIHDVKTLSYTLDRHNNGYNDTIVLVYTITYDPKEKSKSKK